MGNALAVRKNGKLKLQRKNLSEGLADFFDVTNYPASTSDIEALLVFDHQVRMQYVLLESAYKVRQALFDSEQSSDQEASDDLRVVLKEVTETIVSELLFKEEFPLGKKVVDMSKEGKFAKEFMARGEIDSKGRSLRDLDLRGRLFKHRCSYMIYSNAFSAFPDILKNSVFNRIKEVLSLESLQLGYEYLEAEEKKAIVEILSETLSGF